MQLLVSALLPQEVDLLHFVQLQGEVGPDDTGG